MSDGIDDIVYFCDNELCINHVEIRPSRWYVDAFTLDGHHERRILRREYGNSSGKRLYLCDICQNAIEMAKRLAHD